jgi:hypothetical protein
MVELSLFMHRDCDIRNLFWHHQIKKVFSEKFHQSLLIPGDMLHDWVHHDSRKTTTKPGKKPYDRDAEVLMN